MMGWLPRYRSVGAAVVGMLAVTVAVAGCQGRSAAAGKTAGPSPSAFLAAVQWDAPVLLAGGRSIQVSADVMHLPNYCISAALPVLRPAVAETTTSVTVQVRAYRPDSYSVAGGSCAASGHVPVPVVVQLQQPLGRRTLKDAGGSAVPVLDAAQLLTPGYLPAGYRQTAFGGTPTTGTYRSYERLPQAADGSQLELNIVKQLPPRQPLYGERELAAGTVLGHPARVVQTAGTIAVQRCVTWSDQPYLWSICTAGGYPPEISASQLLRIGNSLR